LARRLWTVLTIISDRGDFRSLVSPSFLFRVWLPDPFGFGILCSWRGGGDIKTVGGHGRLHQMDPRHFQRFVFLFGVAKIPEPSIHPAASGLVLVLAASASIF